MINNTVIKINKAKTLLKQISCDCKCESDKYQCKCKKHCMWKKEYSWHHKMCICENSSYFESIFDDTVIVCDKTISVTESCCINKCHKYFVN